MRIDWCVSGSTADHEHGCPKKNIYWFFFFEKWYRGISTFNHVVGSCHSGLSLHFRVRVVMHHQEKIPPSRLIWTGSFLRFISDCFDWYKSCLFMYAFGCVSYQGQVRKDRMGKLCSTPFFILVRLWFNEVFDTRTPMMFTHHHYNCDFLIQKTCSHGCHELFAF